MDHTKPKAGHEPPRVMPLTISSSNSVAVTGMSWIWVRRFARAHGVPIWQVGTRKQLVPAAALLTAIEREAAKQPAHERTDEEERVWMRQQLGVVRKDGRR